ncbi:outer membrane protein [Paraburkholderia sp. BL25I1N1]|uniref:outer membrane protein n=1 Tax=Paraburkholderia sp. BL25I1N1 TaxID=1938804 RepID=UPI000D057A5D|nr:outer membrane immunogenic protein [Paraburkholderia sp. BL25I1N1]
MYKITRLILTASIMMLSNLVHAQSVAPQTGASEFAGPYVGFKLGVNTSDASGVHSKASHATVFPGFTAGYNFDVDRFVAGAEVFADLHHGSTTYKDGGIDAKFGMPFNQFMPYVRIGLTTDWPNIRPHWGLGVEYKFAKHVSAVGEWTTDTSNHDGTRRTNNSFTIGVQYHFN